LFNALHLYFWPGLLTLAIAAYVFTWMRLADYRHPREAAIGECDAAHVERPIRTRRFLVLTAVFMVLFAAASPLYLQSASVLALAAFIARTAAAILGVAGVSSYAVANVLWTPRGGFLVTQECISTPLLPVYLAAVCSQSTTWTRRMLGVASAGPLFVVLGVVRLLVVALPDSVVASPLFIVHAFYQLLLGIVVVLLAARWRHGERHMLRHALVGIGVGLAFVYLVGPFYTRMVRYPAGAVLEDPQGAIAFLPKFQMGLYLALWIAAFVAAGWKRFLAGFAVLELTQTVGLVALGILEAHAGLTAHVRDIRGWAVAGPLVVVTAVVNVARARR
jgi:hypothetical protein